MFEDVEGEENETDYDAHNAETFGDNNSSMCKLS